MQHKWKKLTFKFAPQGDNLKCEVAIYGIVVTSLIEDARLIEGVKSEDRNLFREAMNKIYYHCREIYSKDTNRQKPIAAIHDGKVISVKMARLDANGKWEYKVNPRHRWHKEKPEVLTYKRNQIIYRIKNGIEMSRYVGLRLGFKPIVRIRRKRKNPIIEQTMTHKLVYIINGQVVETLVYGQKALCLHYRRKAKQTGNYRAGKLMLRKA
jgi:hypothetical protein